MPTRKKKRNVFTYDLKRGRKVVYKGTTNNPTRRAQQHKEEGKKFTHLLITSSKMTKEGAKRKEKNALKTYRRNHGGRNPRYNKDSDG